MKRHLAALALLLSLVPVVPAHATHAPEMAQALGPGVTSPTGGIAAGRDLFRVDVDTSRFPDALCNDGSPGVFYVRRYSGAQNAGRWVIYLQGGGSCRDGDSCAGRWLHRGTNYGANKMSSTFAPAIGIRGGGIESPGPQNNFANWNHVFVYYCSSDTWTGTRADAALSGRNAEGAVVDYSINFHGADIVDAVIGSLQQGVRFHNETGAELAMPDLDAATHVVFSGSSAGGGGAIQNADRVRETLRRDNVHCPLYRALDLVPENAARALRPPSCPLVYAAVPDATFEPSLEYIDFSRSGFCLQYGLCTYQEVTEADWSDTQQAIYGASVDESCLAAHEPAGDEWRCGDGGHVIRNHVTSPLFVRMDLQDNLILGNFLENDLYAGTQAEQAAAFGHAVHDQLVALEDLATTAEEGAQREPGWAGSTEPPGYFGAQCADHVTLSNSAFLNVRAPDANGNPVTTNDVLANWLNGVGARSAIVPFAGPGALPGCP